MKTVFAPFELKKLGDSENIDRSHPEHSPHTSRWVLEHIVHVKSLICFCTQGGLVSTPRSVEEGVRVPEGHLEVNTIDVMDPDELFR